MHVGILDKIQTHLKRHTDTNLIVKYGTRQTGGAGTREREVEILKEGMTSETDYYRGYNDQPGVWVRDIKDGSKKKFFMYSRFISVHAMNLGELI